MEIKYVFNTEIDSQDSIEIFQRSLDIYTALNDFRKWLRNEIKYNNKEEYQQVLEQFYSILDDNEIQSLF